MLLKTHDIFTAGVLSLVGSLFIKNPAFDISVAIVLSLVGNHVIDIYGHETGKDGIPERTYHTHSKLRATIYGFIPAVIVYVFFQHLRHINGNNLPVPQSLTFILIQGLLVGPSHLFLDSLTEGGVFVKRNGSWQRQSIANFKYDNLFVNLTASLTGILCFVPFLPKNLFSNRLFYLLILIKHII